MLEVERPGDESHWRNYASSRRIAWKTGTSYGHRDAWAIGVTPDHVVGVWVGNADHTPMRDITGLTGAAPIWHQFMRAVLTGTPKTPFPPPPGLKQVEVCTLSGQLPSDACPYRRAEWFIPGTEPSAYDTFYKRVEIDMRTGLPANDATPASRRAALTLLDLPAQAHSWARREGLPLLTDWMRKIDVGPAAGATPAERAAALQVIYPPPNSVYLLSDSLAAEAQRLRIEASGAEAFGQVSLWVDDVEIAVRDAPPYQGWWTLTPGAHTCRAEALTLDGRSLVSEEIPFTVLPP